MFYVGVKVKIKDNVECDGKQQCAGGCQGHTGVITGNVDDMYDRQVRFDEPVRAVLGGVGSVNYSCFYDDEELEEIQ